MQNDILFDNIYIGHSTEDAEKLKAETFDIKHPIELAEEAASKPKTKPNADASDIDFMEDPVAYIRSKVDRFIELAQEDPVEAVKTVPEVAGGLGALVITVILVILGAVGISSPAPPPAKKDEGKDKAGSKEKAAQAASSGADTGKGGATKRSKSNQ